MYKRSTVLLTVAFLVAGCVVSSQKAHKEDPRTSQKVRAAGSIPDWVLAARYEEGNQNVLVDVWSIRVEGDIRHAWIRWVYPPTASKAQSYIMYGSAFNCADGTNRDESVIIYYNDGTNYVDDSNVDDGTTCRNPRIASRNFVTGCLTNDVTGRVQFWNTYRAFYRT